MKYRKKNSCGIWAADAEGSFARRFTVTDSGIKSAITNAKIRSRKGGVLVVGVVCGRAEENDPAEHMALIAECINGKCKLND